MKLRQVGDEHPELSVFLYTTKLRPYKSSVVSRACTCCLTGGTENMPFIGIQTRSVQACITACQQRNTSLIYSCSTVNNFKRLCQLYPDAQNLWACTRKDCGRITYSYHTFHDGVTEIPWQTQDPRENQKQCACGQCSNHTQKAAENPCPQSPAWKSKLVQNGQMSIEEASGTKTDS